jgi:hypothetical protein
MAPPSRIASVPVPAVVSPLACRLPPERGRSSEPRCPRAYLTGTKRTTLSVTDSTLAREYATEK